MKAIMQKLERLRIEKGLAAKDVNAAIGFPEHRYYKWRDGTGEPTGSQALLFAKFFGVPVEWLVDDEQPVDHVPPQPWTEDEMILLHAIRSIGAKEAMRRLVVAAPPANENAEVIRAEKPAGPAEATPPVFQQPPPGPAHPRLKKRG